MSMKPLVWIILLYVSCVTCNGGGIDLVVEATETLPWMCEHSRCVIDVQLCSEICMGYPLF